MNHDQRPDVLAAANLQDRVSWHENVGIRNLDADGNGTADVLCDGVLILRYLFDVSGSGPGAYEIVSE